MVHGPDPCGPLIYKVKLWSLCICSRYSTAYTTFFPFVGHYVLVWRDFLANKPYYTCYNYARSKLKWLQWWKERSKIYCHKQKFVYFCQSLLPSKFVKPLCSLTANPIFFSRIIHWCYKHETCLELSHLFLVTFKWVSHLRIAVITVISGFNIQTRLVGHSALYRMVLTH